MIRSMSKNRFGMIGIAAFTASAVASSVLFPTGTGIAARFVLAATLLGTPRLGKPDLEPFVFVDLEEAMIFRPTARETVPRTSFN